VDFLRISILAAALLASTPAAADPITGHPGIVDGDTLRIGQVRVRLFGIDAPERHQACTRTDGQAWACGADAGKALAGFIGGRSVECEQRDVDRYQRVVATCSVGGDDIGRWMVLHGWAIAYRRYSMDYVADEDQAREAKRGIWSGSFELPSAYRKSHKVK
jgi:endonuclease YncB( thermonuclease family)